MVKLNWETELKLTQIKYNNWLSLPLKKMITKPEKAIRTDVPRSGCLKISAVGRSTRINDATIFVLFNGIDPDAMYLATISGIAILRSSEG